MVSTSDFRQKLQVALMVAAAQSVFAGPCDIYESGGTPCVAAHGATRALYSSYSGSLYQVIRGSDNTTLDITPLSAGGVANAASQDAFCNQTTCLITTIYDQSGNGNHLTRAPPGGFDGPYAGGYDNLASAIGAPVTLNGQKAYGVFSSPGTGYRIDNTTNIPTGNEAQGIYAVLDGTHYNDECCFDYGNAEVSNTDTGPGHMEAVYFGNCTDWGSGSGSGPWIMADLEDGLFSGYSAAENPADPTVTSRFVTSIVKGTADLWSIRGGDSVSGGLSTYYSGVRPVGYNPMFLEGSIILGIGGDNSNGGQGTFYEGVMTSGYPSNATEDAVQANIVAAGYGVTSLMSGSSFNYGDHYSFQSTTPGFTSLYLAHTNSAINTQEVSDSSSAALRESASWIAQAGLGNSGCLSFESVDTPGSYMRLQGSTLSMGANDGTKQFAEDATFCSQAGMSGQGDSFRSWNQPTRYIRQFNNVGYAASYGGRAVFEDTATFNDDVSFVVGSGLA